MDAAKHVALLCAVMNVLLGVSFAQQCSNIAENDRFDCFPEGGASQQTCQARGCCWSPAARGHMSAKSRTVSGATNKTKMGVPYCFYPRDFPSYSVSGSVKATAYGYTANLTRSTKSYYPKDIMNLRLDVYMEEDNRLHFKIFDPNNARYEVPISTPPFTKLASNPTYKVNFQSSPFGIVVSRASNSEVIFNTTINPGFIYADQFIQMSSSLASSYIYGLGEHRSSLALPTDWQMFTFWSRDQPPLENSNLYGVHPFYVNLGKDGDTHGVFLLNSNAMDAILQPAPAITYRTIGGILDFYIFLGPDPIDVVKQYQEVIGKPFMPPMWSLGFHLCRWGYGSAEGTMEVVERMRKAMIPQDAQWNDIDYMAAHKDWTLDPEKYNNLSNVVANLRSNGQHYMFILDPAISSSQTPGTYPPYDTGVTEDVFIKSQDGSIFIGRVWPGDTAFPDWFHPNTSSWWLTLAQKFHDNINFDGMWLDMNEPSNFISGSKTGCPNNTYNNPPYVPHVTGGELQAMTVCPSAVQHPSLHYNLHSMYGLSEVMVSHGVLSKIRNKRPFIISRSTFPSSGKYGGHWLGDNRSLWPEMHDSIIGILTFNMFGIPMVGADICGFNLNTTEELCTRWMQLGAFYPFSRNHNSLGMKDQDPAVFSQASQDSSRDALLIRYSLLPFLYTLFAAAHQNGTQLVRPLFFDFPRLPALYEVDTQFMIGEAILISPVLTEGATTVNATFPFGRWYDNYGAPPMTFTQCTSVILDAPLDKINIHLRGGFIIPSLIPATTTTETRQNPFMMIVALDESGTSNGHLYWDDGDTIGTFEDGAYIKLVFAATSNTMTSTVVHDGFSGSSDMMMRGGVVFGVTSDPQIVTINGKSCTHLYQQAYQKLSITCPNTPMNKPVTLKWA